MVLAKSLSSKPVKEVGDFTRKDNAARRWQSHVAEEVFMEMLEEANVELFFHKLENVTKVAARIKTISMRDGNFLMQKFL